MEVLIQVILISFIEGITEFLPISSTAHILLLSEWLNFDYVPDKIFEIAIQLGAILPVLLIYRDRFILILKNYQAKQNRNFIINILISFLPIALAGLFLHEFIKGKLFNKEVIAFAMILGGFLLIYMDFYRRKSVKILELSAKHALIIGIAQALAIIPGMSRAAMAIIGAMLVGLSKKEAIEYSFFLGLPTILAAVCFDLFSNFSLLQTEHLQVIFLGFIFAFFSSYLTVKYLILFVENFGFKHFGGYRVAFGLILGIFIIF